MALTILGGKGFVGGTYVRQFYDAAIGNIINVNEKLDYSIYSKDVLYFISTVDNYNIFTDPTLDIDTNLKTLVRVLENWRRRPDSKEGVFNFISSWFVYGTQENPHGVREDAVCEPKGFYSITKRCAEQLLVSYCETFGLKYRILRLSNVVGHGDHKTSARKNALQYMLRQLANGEDVNVYDYDGGKFYRDYIHAEDCAQAIETVISAGEVNTIYNIGNGQSWYFIDIIRYAARALQSNSSITLIGPKEFHKTVQTPSFYMDVSKLRGLGFTSNYLGYKLFDTLIKEAKNEATNCRGECST